MTLFSANLGFLWTDRPLLEAVRAAHRAGFDALECHWPYDVSPFALKDEVRKTGLSMIGLNTIRGAVDSGENGLSALVGRQADARAAIDQALAYAIDADIQHIHVMAGFASGKAAHQTFVENLRYACQNALLHQKIILIEPLNHLDAPHYFLNHCDQARDIIAQVDMPNLKLMFDCYHIAILQGDVKSALSANIDIIGHIQFASVPTRGAPDEGTLDYQDIFLHLSSLGYDAPLGAEYRPKGADTDASLGWLSWMGANQEK